MLTLLIVLAAVGYALMLRRQFDWPVESVPLPLAAGLISVLYLFALVGLLRPGSYVLVAVGLGLFVFHLVKTSWSLQQVRRMSPALLAFAVLAVAISWRHHDAEFASWDEFSHWGLASKTLIQTHALPTTDSPLVFKDYPPASALFHYLLSVGSGFSENRMYIAQTFLALAAITALCIGARWRRVVATFVFGYFGLFTFAGGFYTMHVDHLLGLFFGCGLGSFFLSRDAGRVARLIPVVFALPLLKSVGLMLAILVVCAAIADQLLTERLPRRRILPILLLALAPIAASSTWNHHVKTLGTPPTFPLEITAGRIRNSFSADHASERDRATIAAFRQALTTTPVTAPRVNRFVESGLSKLKLANWNGPGLTVSVGALVFGLIAATLLAVQPDGRARARLLSSTFWLAVCGVCYAFGLLILYLYSFSAYEGVRLASFARYFGILLLGVSLVLLAWALSGSRNGGWRGAVCKGVVGVLAVGMAYLAPDSAILFAIAPSSNLTDQRKEIREVLRPALSRAGPADRVFMVWEGSTGFEMYVGHYEAAPVRTNLNCWSLGSPRFAGDVWTCRKSPAAWAALLENFEYVVIGRADQAFWDEYGELFKGSRDASAYKVVKSDSNARLYLEAMVDPPTPESRARRARDEKRVADIHEIQAALESYISRVGPLPTPQEYKEATGASKFWEGWWDVSGRDENGNGHPFLDFLVERGILPSVPVDPLNNSRGSPDPLQGNQYVYFVVPPGYGYEGGACEPAPDRWQYLIGITDLESEAKRPPRTFSGSGCACLWRNAPNFFQQSFDYILCGSFRR